MEKLIKLSMKRQIQIGVVVVVGCVCILFILLVIITSYVIVSVIYEELLEYIDNEENTQITEIHNLINSRMTSIIENSKISSVWISNYYYNLKSLNKAYLDNYKSLEVPIQNGVLIYDDLSKLDTLEDDILNNKSDFGLILLLNQDITDDDKIILNRLFSVVKTLKNLRINENQDNGINSIRIYSKDFLIMYPIKKFKASAIIKINDNIQKFFDKTIEENVEDSSPILLKSDSNNQIYDFIDSSYSYPIILSSVVRKNNVITLINLNENLIDVIFQKTSSIYDGLSILITNKDNLLYTKSDCFKLIELFDLDNGLVGKNTLIQTYIKKNLTVSNIIDCFPYEKAKTEFNAAFNNTLVSDKMVIKSIIQLINEYYDNSGKSIDITIGDNNSISYSLDSFQFNDIKNSKRFKYKMFESTYPTKYNLDATNQLFQSNSIDEFRIYCIKSQREIENDHASLSKLYYSVVYLILYMNFAIWIFIVIIILLLLMKTTNLITKPIVELTKIILDINSGETSNLDKKKQKLEKMRYNYDSNINELFKMCKNLIKGGFSDNRESDKKTEYLDLIEKDYSTRIVKSNNYIIQENLIIKTEMKQAASIFTYNVKGNDDNQKQDEGKNDIFYSKKKVKFNFPTEAEGIEPEGYFSTKSLNSPELKEILLFIKANKPESTLNAQFNILSNKGKDIRDPFSHEINKDL